MNCYELDEFHYLVHGCSLKLITLMNYYELVLMRFMASSLKFVKDSFMNCDELL